VRDAWERQVSAVYPEARADFDTTVIRLHASPAPLQRKLVAGAHLTIVPPAAEATDDKGALPSELPARFFAAVTAAIGPGETRAWFHDAELKEDAGRWCLAVATAFKADWIRSRFQLALERGRDAAGLEATPDVVVRPR
jgi:hypothetical protein